MGIEARGSEIASRLYGRSAERETVRDLLADTPLITITGLPGVGKTAVAMEAAAAAAPDFPDGMLPLSIDQLMDPGLLAYTIGTALELQDGLTYGGPGPRYGGVGDGRVLLIFDTCDYMTEACAEIAAMLLSDAPNLRIIATSRRPLSMAGERVLTLPPLGEPDDVALFFDRARAVVPNLRITPSDRAEAAEVCRKLDGIPLGIELAARRLRDSSLAEVSADLDALPLHHLDRDGEGRHDSLVSSIGWSHQNCTPLQRLLWARLSVFEDVFEARDAEEVCGGHPLPAPLVEETIIELAESSLLLVVRDGPHDRAAYYLPRTLRSYGAEILRLLDEDVRLHHRYGRWRAGDL